MFPTSSSASSSFNIGPSTSSAPFRVPPQTSVQFQVTNPPSSVQPPLPPTRRQQAIASPPETTKEEPTTSQQAFPMPSTKLYQHPLLTQKRECAEVYLIGELESAEGWVDQGNQGLSCRWALNIGGGWRVIAGEREGHTQTDSGAHFERCYFAHPIDLHLATQTIQGWPKILLEVWHADRYGRREVCGYGVALIPTSPGEHQIECCCWRVKGSFREELRRRFLGGGIRLRSLETLVDPVQRARLQTVAAGRVHLRIGVITRHFDRFGIMC